MHSLGFFRGYKIAVFALVNSYQLILNVGIFFCILVFRETQKAFIVFIELRGALTFFLSRLPLLNLEENNLQRLIKKIRLQIKVKIEK